MMNSTQKLKVVDAHAHIYDSGENRHEFLENEDKMFRALIGDYSTLPRSYSVADYLEETKHLEIDGLVWTEFLSTDPIKEVLWGQRIAEKAPIPIAMVGLVDFASTDLERTLDIYSHCSKMSAVRQHLGWDQDNPLRRFAKRPDLLVDPLWLQGLKTLKKYPLKCSLEVFSTQLPMLFTVLQSNPDIRFAIAVMGWPLDLNPSGFSKWKQDLKALSACSNVQIVISAIECVFGMGWSVAKVQPWINSVLELFGPSRIMFGSHRPICKLSTTFPEPYSAHEELTACLSDSEKHAVFRNNAAAWLFDNQDG
jgi:predicted TIM-barrel fold metal-dependent hydrolase